MSRIPGTIVYMCQSSLAGNLLGIVSLCYAIVCALKAVDTIGNYSK